MKNANNVLTRLRMYLAKILAREVWYIGSSDILPAPLSGEEKQQVLMQLREGNAEAKTKLVEHNLRLVVYIARKFDNTGIALEDLISIGTIGLIKAVNTFDPDKKIKLATYASRCIENEILMYLRKTSRSKGDISLDMPLNVDLDGNELLLADILGTDPDTVYNRIESDVDHELLRAAMDTLCERDKLIISLRFGLGQRSEKTQKEVAELLGISQSYISRLEKRIIDQLRNEMKKMA